MTPSIPRLAREAIELSEKATKGPWTVRVFDSVDDAKEDGNFEWCSLRFNAFEGREVGCVWKDVSDKQDGSSITGLPGSVETDADTATLIAHAGTHYGTLARYVEDTAAIVEAARVYSELEEKANELAAMNTSVTEFSIAVRAQGDAYRTLMEKVRAYRAKGAT